MKGMRQWQLALLVCAGLCLGGATQARATTIGFETTDDIDLVIGEDLWTYQFFLSGFTFGVNQGFTVYFSPTLYAAIQDPAPSAGPDWDLLTLQPDIPPGVDGIYDALALTNGASLAGPFRVSFVWLGSGTPGPQAFSINQFDDAGGLTTLEAGTTSPHSTGDLTAVPEPASWLLLALGVTAYLGRRLRRHPA